MDMSSIVPYFGIIGTIFGWFIAWIKYSQKIDGIIFSTIFKGHTKLEKIALGARIARFSLVMTEFLKTDLINGRLDKLDQVEAYIKSLH